MKKNAVSRNMSFSIICSPFIVMCIIGIDSFLIEYFLTITICLSGIVYLIKLFNKLLGELICGNKNVSMELQDSKGATNKGILGRR